MTQQPTLDAAPKSRTERPKLYAVVLLNDDFTSMDFVVQILIQIFGHDRAKAESVMMDIHKTGKGVAGIYTHEVAETKALLVEMNAKGHEYPLKAEVVPESTGS